MAILFPLLLGVFFLSLFLSAFFLWLAGRLLKAPRATIWRAILTTAIMTVVGIVSLPVSIWLSRVLASEDIRTPLLAEGILLVSQLLVTWLVISSLFQTTFFRAILIYLVNLIPAGVLFVVVYFGLKTYVIEAYVIPSNGMAPTLIGWHQLGVCPHCEGVLIVPIQAPHEPAPWRQEEERLCICSSCRKTSRQASPAAPSQNPDRILVNKLLRPDRWDLIVFRYPKEPTQKWVKRLVGLPGETVYIKDGAVWINGVKMDPPAKLAGLHYTTGTDGFRFTLGTPEEPIRLEQNQYCVLGDFSERASDSRDWGPVPGDHLEGVVSACYWPIGRWQIFR